MNIEIHNLCNLQRFSFSYKPYLHVLSFCATYHHLESHRDVFSSDEAQHTQVYIGCLCIWTAILQLLDHNQPLQQLRPKPCVNMFNYKSARGAQHF